MISFSWRSGVQSTMQYFDQHLAVGDYYLAQGEDPTAMAQWLGEGAARLNLVGVVRRDDFESITKNLHPDTGDRLTARMNATGDRRTWWDVAVSPPKDVSVYAALADGQTRTRIHRMHWEATKVAGRELEKFLGVRVRSHNRDGTKVGNCEAVIAAVMHDTARPVDGVPDPHLHTHLLFANAVFDRDSGRWMALQNEGAIEAQTYALQVYYNELVRGIESLGIQTETRERQKDFVIAGMDRELVDRFSRRHFQVEERAREKMKQGMWDREAAEDIAAIDGRESKVTFSPEEFTAKWREIAGSEMLAAFDSLRSRQRTHSLRESSLVHLFSTDAIQFVKGHTFQNVSVVKEHRLLADLLRVGRGNFTLESAKASIREDSEFLSNKEGEFTTRRLIAEERGLLHLVNSGTGIHEALESDRHQLRDGPAGDSWKYSREQMTTIRGVLCSRDFVVAINGVAGAGKTTLLKEIEFGIASKGRKMIPLAPSGQATGILRGEGFGEAETLQQWLVNGQLREATHGVVIVVDEAGMISVPAMKDLIEKAIQGDNRVVLIGDTKQIQSVQRGDAFRLLQNHSKMQTFQVQDSRRQKVKVYKDAVTQIRHASEKRDWIRAWQTFESLNAIEEVPGDSRTERESGLMDMVAEKFREDPERLIVAARWTTIHALNETIRRIRLEAGELGSRETVKMIYEPVHLSAEDKRRGAAYEVGQHLQLVRDLQGVGLKQETFEMVGRQRGKIILKNRGGQLISASPWLHHREFKCFNPRQIHLREGEVLLIKQNLGDLKNGNRVRLRQIHDDHSLTVEAGEKQHRIPADFRHFLHGYAVTAHASQGATVESVVVIGDSMTREQFYVAATRGRSGIKVVTTDRPLMEAAVKISGERKAAIEHSSTTGKIDAIRKRDLVAAYRRRGREAAHLIKAAIQRTASHARQAVQDLAPWLKEKLTNQTRRWNKQHQVRTPRNL